MGIPQNQPHHHPAPVQPGNLQWFSRREWSDLIAATGGRDPETGEAIWPYLVCLPTTDDAEPATIAACTTPAVMVAAVSTEHYLIWDAQERYEARGHLVHRIISVMQSAVIQAAVDTGFWVEMMAWERMVLTHEWPADRPWPTPEGMGYAWTSPVTLYECVGDMTPERDGHRVPYGENVVVLDPATDVSLMTTLHSAELVQVFISQGAWWPETPSAWLTECKGH